MSLEVFVDDNKKERFRLNHLKIITRLFIFIIDKFLSLRVRCPRKVIIATMASVANICR